MRTITFPNSWFGQIRADLHKLPYSANNALVRVLKTQVNPIVTERSAGIAKELHTRPSKIIDGVIDTTQLNVGDIVSISLRQNGESKTVAMSPIVFSVTQKTQAKIGVISVKVFGSDNNHEFKSHSTGRVSQTLWAYVPTKGESGKELRSGPNIKIGTLEIRRQDIASITLHRTPLIKKLQNSVKRGYNRILDGLSAEARVFQPKQSKNSRIE